MLNPLRLRLQRRALFAAVASLIAASTISSLGRAAHADWRDDVGYTKLVQELTALSIPTPTGSGIIATQVEADESGDQHLGNYRPDPNYPPPSGGEFIAPPITKTFVYKTTAINGTSTHASVVGTYLYGNTTSVATGVGTVNIWEANDWITNSVKAAATATPIVETGDVANFSWIGTTGNSASDTDITRRLDYQINRDDFVAVVAMNNGSSTTLPNLLGQGYNTISVGLSSAIHSHGTTTIDGSGRMKPDIVAPAPYTSYATPMVGAAAEMLLEPAKALSANAAHSQTIKAVLMAGATKTTGVGGLASTWSHTQTQPLDTTYGAGQLNIDRSYHILNAGEQMSSSSQVTTPTGWDFNSYALTSPSLYFFDVPANTTLSELSAVLTWNAVVTHTGPSYSSTLSNLDLSLWSASGFTLGSMLDQSISTVDNVELLSLHNLTPGRYALNVTGTSGGVDYALAWYAATPDVTWIGVGGTTWSTATASNNWKKPVNGSLADYTDGVNVTFDDLATETTVDISTADVTPANVLFNNSTNNFTITGTKGIAGVGTTVTKRGTGTVTIGSVNQYTGKTIVEAGTLVLQGTTNAMAPVLTSGGADITGGMLVLDYSSEASPAATVDTLMRASYDPAGPNHFDVGQFMSTTADDSHGLGWVDNPATEKISVAYTLYGDTNLDGTTNFTDLSKLLSTYNQSGVWADGDTNYDGTVNFTDLSKMLSTYSQSVGLLTPAPEPSGIVMLSMLASVVGVWLIRRRRSC